MDGSLRDRVRYVCGTVERFISIGRIARSATIALVLVGCTGSKTQVVTPTAAASPSAREVLPFIHDDYPKALAEAKRRNKPLFVDAWAPWCHSCQSLRSFVLTDPLLAPLASDFVWLSVDTEKDVNAEWVNRHPHSALPTIWVLEPATDRPILKWAGTLTAEELRGLLTVSVSEARTTESPAVAATAAFVRGNHALAEGDVALAEKEHRAALAAASKDHPHRARIVEALVTQLSVGKQHGPCAALAAAEAGDLAAGTSRASTLVAGLACAREAKLTTELERLTELALRDAKARDATLLADDRSALYEELIGTRQDRGDAAGALALARDWSSFLEGEAARAVTNDARASLDPWRLSAFIALGEPARAIPFLERSEKDFPDDYNPPARLGRAYLEMKRLDDADRAADRAIARVYGPRAMRVFGLKADIAKARGDRAAEASALERALARSEHAVLTEGQKSVRDGLVKRLARLR
jgi:thioredoxin-like negative regulator of GroEL